MTKLGLPSNFRDRKFNKIKGEWENTFDYNSMKRHYEKFKTAMNAVVEEDL